MDKEILITFFWFFVIYGAFVLVIYPTKEGGDKTLFGWRSSYLVQKFFELVALPIIVGVVLTVLN